jgi:hypothetical protein
MTLAVVCSLSGQAQDKGYWRAASSNAKTITGDVTISDGKLSINFARFTIAEIRKLTPEETAAAFDANSNANCGATLYRLSIPAAKTFLRHNTLCGSEDTQWMATYASEDGLQVAFFSGAAMPVFKVDVLANSTSACGVYAYVR